MSVEGERGSRPGERGTPPSLDPETVARHELIGLRCRVCASGDPGLAGVHGEVVDETMRTLTLRTERGERVVPKHGQEFQFTLPDGSTHRLRGGDLAHRPEERTKRARSHSQKVNHAHA